MVGRWFSFQDGLFSGAMLVSGRVFLGGEKPLRFRKWFCTPASWSVKLSIWLCLWGEAKHSTVDKVWQTRHGRVAWLHGWSIIPPGKWLIALVSKSLKYGCSPSKWPYKWRIANHLLRGMILQVPMQPCVAVKTQRTWHATKSFSWWLNNPFKKNMLKWNWIISTLLGVKIKRNHQLESWLVTNRILATALRSMILLSERKQRDFLNYSNRSNVRLLQQNLVKTAWSQTPKL